MNWAGPAGRQVHSFTRNSHHCFVFDAQRGLSDRVKGTDCVVRYSESQLLSLRFLSDRLYIRIKHYDHYLEFLNADVTFKMPERTWNE